jgi:hypothetical protein
LTSFGDDVPICAAWETRPRYILTSLFFSIFILIFIYIYLLCMWYVWYAWSRLVLGCVW